MRLLAFVPVVAALLGAPSCGGKAPTGPPELHLGADTCDGCGMAIADPRFAAAAIVDEAGDLKVLRFDDIGCMARWEVRARGLTVRERWVHDRGTRAWTEATAATYAQPRGLVTPMGSGLVAYQRAPDAAALASDSGGESLSWSAVIARTREGSLTAQPERPAEEPR